MSNIPQITHLQATNSYTLVQSGKKTISVFALTLSKFIANHQPGYVRIHRSIAVNPELAVAEVLGYQVRVEAGGKTYWVNRPRAAEVAKAFGLPYPTRKIAPARELDNRILSQVLRKPGLSMGELKELTGKQKSHIWLALERLKQTDSVFKVSRNGQTYVYPA